MKIELLFQNDDLLVINKPAGLPVHAGSGGGDNLENHLEQFRLGKKMVPHLAHRLDRDTSGCLILGRSKEALRKLGKLFEHKRIHKSYWAIVSPIPTEKQGSIDTPLAKISADKRRWHMQVDPNGQTALTHYKVLGEHNGLAWLEMKPKTGRTHQLRVHCAHIGSPIVGDIFYGDENDARPLMLHARSLTIPYIQGEQPIIVDAPVPEHMRTLMPQLARV